MENKDVNEEITPIVVPSYKERQEQKKGWLGSLRQKRHEKKQEKLRRKGEKVDKVLRQTHQILPFLQIQDGYIEMKEGVMEIYQIDSQDLYSKNDADINRLIYTSAAFHRSYYEPIKIVAMNFPSNTEKQKSYWNKKRTTTDDPVLQKFIDRKLFEFDFLERERTNREFFLFLYANNKQQIEERKKQVIRGMQQSFPLKELTNVKKQDVLFVLNNQNTKL